MRWNSFARTLLFGALAGALYPAWMLLGRPLFGPGAALPLYLVAIAALYVAGLGARPTRGLVAGLLALLLGGVVLVLAGSAAQVAIGAALVVGLCRSGLLLHRAQRARALVIEAALLAGGLAFARFLAAPSLAGVALAVWGFFLVQSVYFLIGGVHEPRAGAANLDPFDLARSRALALFEED